MRHNSGLKKLNRTSSHRKALLKNMAISLIRYEQIRTTLAKSKVLRPFVEKLITMSKTKDLHTIRKLYSILRDNDTVAKLVDDIGPRVAKRPGGYTRIYKFGFRYGDAAPMGLIELVDRNTDSLKTNAPKASKKSHVIEGEAKEVKNETKKAAPKVKADSASVKNTSKKASENKKSTTKVIRRTSGS